MPLSRPICSIRQGAEEKSTSPSARTPLRSGREILVVTTADVGRDAQPEDDRDQRDQRNDEAAAKLFAFGVGADARDVGSGGSLSGDRRTDERHGGCSGKRFTQLHN